MLNFPDAPTNGAVFTSAGKSWVWDTVKWGATGVAAVIGDPVLITHGGTSATSAPAALANLGALPLAGGVMTGVLGVPGINVSGTGITYSAYEGHSIAFGWTGSQINLRVDGNPVGAMATKGDLGNYVAKPGDAMTGRLTITDNTSYPLALNTNGANSAISFYVPGVRQWASGIDNAGNYFFQDITASGAVRLAINTAGVVSTQGAVSVGGRLDVALDIVSSANMGCISLYATNVFVGNIQVYNNGGYLYSNSSIYSGADVRAGSNLYAGGTCYAANFSSGWNNLGAAGYTNVVRDDSSYNTQWYNQSGLGRFWSSRLGDGFTLNLTTGDAAISGNYFYKPGGGSFTDSSDISVKKDVVPYTHGLSEVVRLTPVVYGFNGKGGTIDDGRRHVGLIANDVLPVMPEMIHVRPPASRVRYGPDENPVLDEEGDLLALDATALTYALVNAVKELAQRLAALEGTKP